MTEQAPEGADPAAIAADWADDYPLGAELFCGTFDAADFSDIYGNAEYPDGTTVAVRRFQTPNAGFLEEHIGDEDVKLALTMLRMHCSDRAWKILTNLTADVFAEFSEAWQEDSTGGKGKSNRSSRRAASKSKRFAATS